MAFKEPTLYAKTGDAVFTAFAQEVELQSRITAGKYNEKFVLYRNTNSRVFLKNGQKFRLLAEIDGKVDTEHPLAIGVVSCAPKELQSFYVHCKIEEPVLAGEVKDPALEQEIPVG